MKIIPVNNNQYNNRPSFGTKLDKSLRPILEYANQNKAITPERMKQLKEVANNGLEGKFSFMWSDMSHGVGNGLLIYEDPVLDAFHKFESRNYIVGGEKRMIDKCFLDRRIGDCWKDIKNSTGAFLLLNAFVNDTCSVVNRNTVGDCCHFEKTYNIDKFFDTVSNDSIKSLHEVVSKRKNSVLSQEAKEAKENDAFQKELDELFS